MQPSYDDDGLLSMVVVYDPAYLVVHDVAVRTDQQLEDAEAALEAVGFRGRRAGGTTWYGEAGVMLYAPNRVVEGAGAYRRGYDTGG